ncbi:hypothetical protein HMPREF1531_01277 [Propionibacterium sp. oral taxon 192 str. F0372]|uniref:hypothetical protein n=1 Tax=Propionibacterium sp. oral taxon 192 TaxID=671222 RepID=UPI00035420DA|nr:hypothetical protein [Propionibacterium sp. oral taxon 192]EPH03220.1 hypothetical protein HMPREF1531_01277 [Propionibacterium sp. oral taxon 192 str. F0372]
MKLKRAAITLTLTALALSTAACGGGSDNPQPSESAANSAASNSASPSASSSSTPSSFEVGDNFGPAKWTLTRDPSHDEDVIVRPEQVVLATRSSEMITALAVYSSSGEPLWDLQLEQGVDVQVLEKTVVMVDSKNVKSSTLDKDTRMSKITLLSLKDGSTQKEIEVPSDKVFTNDETIVFESDNTVNAIAWDGSVVNVDKAKLDRASPGKVSVVGTTLFWPKDNSADALVSANWTLQDFPNLPEKEVSAIDPLAIDNKLGLLIVQAMHGAAPKPSYFAVKAETGEIAYELSCPGYSHSDASTNIARNSPNGKYGVMESIWISADKGRCIGGGEQKEVELLAVDDSGTAYGTWAEEKMDDDQFVTVPANGEAKVSTGYYPVGIMTGGLGVHVLGFRQEGTIFRAKSITGNPPK